MKIIDINLPKIFEYYVVERDRESFKNILLSQDIHKVKDEDSYIMAIPYSATSHSILEVIINKTEIVTVGGQDKYQYELDLGGGPKSHIITMKTDLIDEIKLVMESVQLARSFIRIRFREIIE